MVLITIANHDHQQEKRALVFKRYVGPNEHVLGDAVVFHWLESLSFGEEKERKRLSCGNYFLEKKEKVCYTADDTMVLVMALMETDGKGNSHVCYPVITLNRHENTIYKQNPII